jgi:hypothetical protein
MPTGKDRATVEDHNSSSAPLCRTDKPDALAAVVTSRPVKQDVVFVALLTDTGRCARLSKTDAGMDIRFCFAGTLVA